LLSAIYSGIETAAYSTSEIRIKKLAEEGNGNASIILSHLDDMGRLVTITLIGNNLAVDLGTYILQNYFQTVSLQYAEIWATAILTPFYFLFAETFPKQLGHIMPERFCLAVAKILRGSGIVFLPLEAALSLVTKMIKLTLKIFSRDTVEYNAKESLAAMFEIESDDGTISDEQHQVVRRIMSVESKYVNKIMTPFNKLFSVKKTTHYSDIILKMKESKHSNLPVLSKKKKKVYGIITLKKIMQAEEDSKAEDIMSPPVLLSFNTTVGRALSKIQDAKSRMGVVIDDDGSALGVVTINQLLKNAVGLSE
jgi:CBS domain containing-hemolysin-like protein